MKELQINHPDYSEFLKNPKRHQIIFEIFKKVFGCNIQKFFTLNNEDKEVIMSGSLMSHIYNYAGATHNYDEILDEDGRFIFAKNPKEFIDFLNRYYSHIKEVNVGLFIHFVITLSPEELTELNKTINSIKELAYQKMDAILESKGIYNVDKYFPKEIKWQAQKKLLEKTKKEFK